jgi:ubiquinone/menaquinone biosynthesis C-methylase UbiE
MIIGDAQHIPMASKSVDYVVCIRLLNWVTTAASKEIIREFCRVTRKGIVVGFRTQRDIRALEYIRSLLFDLIPTPHHLRRWKRLLVNFYKRATGKIKHEAAKRGFWKKQRKTRNKGIRNVYHDKNELFIHFSELNLEIVDRVYIDSTASYTKRKVRPYSIYRLEHKKRLGPVP